MNSRCRMLLLVVAVASQAGAMSLQRFDEIKTLIEAKRNRESGA